MFLTCDNMFFSAKHLPLRALFCTIGFSNRCIIQKRFDAEIFSYDFNGAWLDVC